MMFYPLEYVIDKTLERSLSKEQWLLKKLTNKRFDANESRILWNRIADHKWYVSERLGRDIGLKVAAIDFIENIYETPRRKGSSGMSFRIPFGTAENMTYTT